MASKLDLKQVETAASALLKFVNDRKSSSNDILQDEEEFVFLTVSTHRFIPKKKAKPIAIPLRHPIYVPERTEVCLITKDPSSEYEQKLEDQGASKRVSKVLGLETLRKEYKPHEAKRNLFKSYGLFLADRRVLPLLPKLLGKKFFESNALPGTVKLTKTDVKSEIERAMNSTYLHMSTGTTLSIKVGTTNFTPAQIRENVDKILPRLTASIPKQWAGIQRLSLKTGKSPALPIYKALPANPKANGSGEEEKGSEESKSVEEKKESKEENSKKAKEGTLNEKKTTAKVETKKAENKKTEKAPTKKEEKPSAKQEEKPKKREEAAPEKKETKPTEAKEEKMQPKAGKKTPAKKDQVTPAKVSEKSTSKTPEKRKAPVAEKTSKSEGKQTAKKGAEESERKKRKKA
ncbi:uncharacterized protein VTP21DRAFT_1192 [Calcarisporiella thermophila]|uniref:uncharacterized protein n=1 Tax=Calcarisporiella thermophila TaxID=911321 RepID=UPI003743E48E